MLGGVLQKSFPKNFWKLAEKYLFSSLFLTPLKAFTPSGLKLYWRKTPLLVFESKLFVDPLEKRCSWIIYKIHRKALEFESLFKKCLEADVHRCFSKYFFCKNPLQKLLRHISCCKQNSINIFMKTINHYCSEHKCLEYFS